MVTETIFVCSMLSNSVFQSTLQNILSSNFSIDKKPLTVRYYSLDIGRKLNVNEMLRTHPGPSYVCSVYVLWPVAKEITGKKTLFLFFNQSCSCNLRGDYLSKILTTQSLFHRKITGNLVPKLCLTKHTVGFESEKFQSSSNLPLLTENISKILQMEQQLTFRLKQYMVNINIYIPQNHLCMLLQGETS